MGVILFREGDSHEYKNVKCEMKRFENWQMGQALQNGWYNCHTKLYASEKEDLSTDEIREAAKEAGIEGWENKRIKTLKAELGYDDQG